jgi:hypothetical protein
MDPSGWRGAFSVIQLPENPNELVGEMSQSAWCNINDKETNAPFQIGHAFNADDEDREHFTKTRTVNVETGNSYGRKTYQERQEITETLDMCGYHSRKQAGLFQSTEPPAIEATAIEEVEAEAEQSEAEMWRAKYEAERIRTGFVADGQGRVSSN